MISASWDSTSVDIPTAMRDVLERVRKSDGYPKPQERIAVVSRLRLDWLAENGYVDEFGRVTPNWTEYLNGVIDRRADELPVSVLGAYEVQRFVCFTIPPEHRPS